MAPTETFPTEIVTYIANLCTWGVHLNYGRPTTTYTRYHADSARTSWHFRTAL